MANNITQLTAATIPLTGTDVLWIRQAAGNRKVTVTELRNDVGGNLGNLSIDGNLLLDLPNNSTERGPWNPIASMIRATGRCLYQDEDFAEGVNSVGVYNNAGNGAVTHTRALHTSHAGQSAVAVPNSSGYSIRIDYLNPPGAATPGFGGFIQTITSEENHTFVQMFQAKVPTGRSLIIAENSIGTNSTSYWMTNNAGTGKWEWYIRVCHCGDSGTFSSSGHVYVSGGTDASFDWYLASLSCWDVTESPMWASTKTANTFLGTQTVVGTHTVNIKSNATSILTVGESSTLRGDSQDGQITLYGEQTGVIRSASIHMTGSHLSFTGSSTADAQFNMDVDVLAGFAVRIRDTGNTDYVNMTHDGTNFLMTGVNTSNLVIGGLATGIIAQVDTFELESANPFFLFDETDAAADERRYAIEIQGGNFILKTQNDAASVARNLFNFDRSGAAVTTMVFGNATDNPTFTFSGSGAITTGGAINLGHASDTALARVSAGVVSIAGSNILKESTGLKQGLTTIPVMAGAMKPTLTSGATAATTETATNDFTYATLDFSQSVVNYATFAIPMPKNWNDGTVTFQPIWTTTGSPTGDVVWQLQAVATSNDDPLDAAWGTAQVSQDTFLLAGDNHTGPTSAAITVSGTPTTDDLIHFRIVRDPAHVNDSLTAIASLTGIRLFFTTNAADDT